MNFRLTTVLIGAVLLIGGVLLVRSLFVDPALPDTLLVGLSGVESKQIDEVIVERTDSSTTLKFKRVSETEWEITDPIRAKANGPAVKAVVEALFAAKPTVFAELPTNPAAAGLQPPSLKVTLRQGEQKSGTLNIGNVLGGRDGVAFVTTTAKPNRPVAVRRQELDALFRSEVITGGGKAGDLVKWSADYRTLTIFPSDSRAVGEDVTSVRLEMPNKKKTLALSRPLGGAWKFDGDLANWGNADVEGDGVGSIGTFTGVRRLLGALTSVTASSPADFIDNPKDLKEYGLDDGNPDLVKVEMTAREGRATVYLGKRTTAPPPVAPGMPQHAPGGKVFVRVAGQPGVIHATAADLSGLNGVVLDPSSLRDRTLVNADRTKADGIDIQLPGQPAPTKLRFTGELKQWHLYGGPGDPQVTYRASVEKILDVVFARRTIKDFPTANPANFSAVSATLLVWVDGFNPPANEKTEPVKKAEPIKLEFGRRDGEVLYVRRTLPGLQPNEFTIPAQMKVGVASETADVVPTVAVARLDLLDRSLPSFSDAARITVSGTNNYTLTRDAVPDPLSRELLWRFDPTDPRKGQIAEATTVRNEMIYRLANANSSFGRFIDEDPKPEKLAEYGFSPPRLKVVVDMPPNSEPKQVTFEFGKDYPADPDKVYTRIPGRAAVFIMQRRAFDVCHNPDLRDRTIFRAVNGPAVNKIELKGWGDISGTPQELVFEKNKDGVWIATKATLAGFVVDPLKVNAFVDLVHRLQAKSFEKGMPQGSHGFGDKQVLQVTMHWPGGAVAFNLGATPDAGATYYGWSAWLPQTDPVFTFEGALFKPFKDRPGGFAR